MASIFLDPEARVYFLQWRSYLLKSIFVTMRRANLFLTVQLSFDEVDLLDPEACEFIFYSAVSLLMGALMRWSRCCGPRGSLAWQCSLLSGVDLVDPEARVYLISLLVGALF